MKPHKVVGTGPAENRRKPPPSGFVPDISRGAPKLEPPADNNDPSPNPSPHGKGESPPPKRVRPTPPSTTVQAPAGPDVQSRSTPAMLLSIGFHLVLLLLIAWAASNAPRGSGERVDRQIGIAMVHRLPDRDQYEEVTAEESQTTEEQAMNAESASAAAAPPADLSPPIDLDGILAAMESTPAPVSGSGIAGDTQLDGNDFGEGLGSASLSVPGPQATARLFGVSGSGSRFVYVLDRSDSMNGFGGRPLKSAKRELTRSLNSLSERQQFQIIFYNENVKPFQMGGAPLTMVSGEPNHVKRAARYIESIRAFGGTKHKGALLMALRMSPDVIFFLTDAHIPRLSSLELQVIQDRAERSGTTIHAIEFGSQAAGSPGSFLRDLAAMNNGQYQYVDVRKLGEQKLGEQKSDSPTGSDESEDSQAP